MTSTPVPCLLQPPGHLLCEYLSNPLGIDVLQPRLSWQLRAQARGEGQHGYQVLVASTPELLAAGIGDQWDSGEIPSEETLHIEYRGAPLRSRQRCWWMVRARDSRGQATGWSAPATFEMGLLEPEDWQASWIGAAEHITHAPCFRTEFSLEQPVIHARAYICGLGYYELRLNGHKVGDHELDPNWTNYDRREMRDLLYPIDDQSTTRALYVTYDITPLLQPGANALGVLLGNGWHNQREREVEGKLHYGPPRLLLQVEVELADGSRTVVVSDEHWRCANSPLVFNNIFIGEIYDARLEQPGWDLPGFDASGWAPVRPAARPRAPLRAQMSPPDRVMETLAPLARHEPRPGCYVFDFAQNFSGWVRLRVRGAAGDRVTLRFAEEIDADGALDVESTGGQGSSDTQIQRDVYILKGGGEECYTPRFTWHAFRYVEVTGYPGEPPLSALEGRLVHSAIAPIGDFTCSNPLLNAIQTLYRRTQLANYHGCVPSDCPHRERLGYTGDGQLTAEAAMLNFDVPGLYTKWLHDIADAQNRLTGFVPHTAPFYGGGGGPAWGAALPIVAWQLYQYYGDRRVLEEHYAGMAHWVAYLGTRTNDAGLVTREEPGGWCLGDWSLPGPAPLGEDADPLPALVNTAYYGYCARLLAQIAAVLGREEEARSYQALTDTIAQRFHLAFFDDARGCYGSGRHGTEVFALALGAVPAAELPRVLAHLRQNIAANDDHLDTGILGTPLLLDMLVAHEYGELAYNILCQTSYPGYGFMLANGATTMWENWAKENGSHCHPMYGSVSAWFYRVLAGIQVDAGVPGFKRVIVRPHFLGDLSHASASLDTLRGPLAVAWQRTDGALSLQVIVPAGCQAHIVLPASARLCEGEQVVWDAQGYHAGIAGIRDASCADGALTIEVGGGDYRFTSF